MCACESFLSAAFRTEAPSLFRIHGASWRRQPLKGVVIFLFILLSQAGSAANLRGDVLVQTRFGPMRFEEFERVNNANDVRRYVSRVPYAVFCFWGELCHVRCLRLSSGTCALLAMGEHGRSLVDESGIPYCVTVSVVHPEGPGPV